jgi:hypothetical protein
MNIKQEIRDLQERLDALNKLLAEEEAKATLPELFDRAAAMNFLESPDRGYLNRAFSWSSTPQGRDYWDDISYDIGDNDIVTADDLPDAAVIAMQRWVIQSYKEEHGV